MTTLPFLILGSLSLLLLNWLTWKGLKNYLQPKGKTAATALEQQLTEQAFAWRTLIGLLWLVPVWPAIAAVMLWYRLRLRKQILSQSRTCPKCGKETLREMSAQEIKKDARLFTPQERMELNLQTVCIHVYTCTACGETKAESITGEHDYKDAHDAYNHYQECSVCGDKKNVEAHKWNEGVVTQEPNCLVSGIIEYTCTVCGAKDCNDLEGDHDYRDAHDADNHYQECSVCGDKKNIEAHKWDEGVVTDPGTCVTPGSVKYTCTVCSETKTESITGEHDYKDAHDKDNHYQECALCHDKKDVEAHKFVWKIDRAATTTKEGEKHEECSVCGYKKAPVSIEKLSPAAKPRTGDASIVWLVLLVSTGSAAAAVTLYTKRKLS